MQSIFPGNSFVCEMLEASYLSYLLRCILLQPINYQLTLQ